MRMGLGPRSILTYPGRVETYEVALVVTFQPPLTIAREQQAMDCLEALGPLSLEVDDAGCSVTLAISGDDSESARNEAEFTVARALATAGHTMYSAPIRTASVRPAAPA
jgi:hypothetical protein